MEKKPLLHVELDTIRPEEQIAQAKAEDNSNHLYINLLKVNKAEILKQV